jgi:putative hydrolase of the HAD superfamily
LKAILFDADGVIQRPAVDYRQAFATLLASRSDEVDRFVHEVFAAERRALSGRRTFVEDLAALLAGWNIPDRLDDVLEVWTAIETDPTMCDAIASLRAQGIPCYLATNQEAHRGRHMTDTLRYQDLFHREYYSYLLGIAKPDADYFRAILDDLQIAPDELLFIDDNKHNIAAARDVGLRAAVFAPSRAPAVDTLRAILTAHGILWP